MMQEEFATEIELDDALEAEVKEFTMPEHLYLSLGHPKRVSNQPIATALTIPDDLQPVVFCGIALAWTKPAIALLSEIQKATRNERGSEMKNLPYASLRGLLEVNLNGATRIEPGIGLNLAQLKPSKFEPKPFAYLTDMEESATYKLLRSLLDVWMTHYLRPFADKEEVSDELLERLEELWDCNELLKLTPFQSQILPWDRHPQTGTAQAKDTNSYRSLADYAARLIAGHEIFQGCGPMKRIISSGGFFSSVAELITEPIPLSEGMFSLLVSLEIVTIPSLHQPLLKIDVSKRRWMTELGEPGYDRSNINGLVFSKDYCDRVFSFKIRCRKDEKDEWRWCVDHDLAAIRSHLRLSMQPLSVQELASGQADTETCQFLLPYRNSLKEAGKHGIKSGVPELDKLEAFESISELLAPIGLKPFNKFVSVESSRPKDDSASRMINLPTLMGAILELLITDHSVFTPQYLDTLDDSNLEQLLRLQFGLSLEQIQSGRKAFQFNRFSKNQTDELTALIQHNQAALRRLYPNEPLQLIVFYESHLQIEVKLLQKIIQLLYGKSIEVLVNSLPANTHGYKDSLPESKAKAKVRSQARRDAWQPITKQLEARKRRTFCLVMAREYYPDLKQPNKPSHDDRVNKPSTRQALAAMAGSCVQFIVPIHQTRAKKQFELSNFCHRVQSALKDLLFAHSGRIDDVQEKIDQWLHDVPVANRPKEILAITIVRKQKGRARGWIDGTFLPIAIRLKVETGQCEMRCAYEKANSLMITPWSSFSDAIGFIAQISPIKLADKREVQKTRFMEFVRQVISNSVEADAQPLVLIDSSNCVQLWDWLADVRMNAEQIDLGQQYQWMQQEWQGARIVRIRQGLAPGIIVKTQRQFVETSLTDPRSKAQIKKIMPDYTIPCATSSTCLCRLTEVTETGCVTYLSPGSKRLHDHFRGQSCYRSTEANSVVKDSEKKKVQTTRKLDIHQISQNLPFIDQWSTPNPLEIVVTLRQPNDNPDHIAALVESLRYSFGHYPDWTALPAPLFFERVVRDYISEFAIVEDEEAEINSDD